MLHHIGAPADTTSVTLLTVLHLPWAAVKAGGGLARLHPLLVMFQCNCCVLIVRDWLTGLRSIKPAVLQSTTPLHTAVKRQAHSTAKLLLEAGANTNAVDAKVGSHTTATVTVC